MTALVPARLPARASDTHKGTWGTVLVVAGSPPYPGAAVLAALGAARAGAGLVQLAVPDALVPDVLPAVPFAVLLRLPTGEDAAASAVLEAARAARSVVVGPGLGTAASTGRLVARLLRDLELPLVLDADGLNLLAALGPQALAARHGTLVLTPHPGEFVRLQAAFLEQAPKPEGAELRREQARALARATGAIVVLKGHGTVVSDGARAYVEAAGNPGMAKGGMGDVLAGAIGALLANPDVGEDPAAAVALAVHAHAVAGDLAAAELGPEAVLPQDVARLLGRALRT